MIGILPIDKPRDFTSFDVIAKLRGILKMRRLGHSGTLDPMATGVLPVFVGRATRAIDLVPDMEKRYIAGFELGFSTDTQDITGQVISSGGREIGKRELLEILPGFVGRIEQIPPMYSAVKIGGKPLYELAREGKTVERRPRTIEIYSAELIEFDEDTQSGMMEISCSKGTYIRTLINDIGERLGSFGTMTSLKRTYSQGIDLSVCSSLDDVEKKAKSGDISKLLIPTDRLFMSLPKISLNDRDAYKYRNGCEVMSDGPDGRYRIYRLNAFFGIGEIDKGRLRTVRNFFEDD